MKEIVVVLTVPDDKAPDTVAQVIDGLSASFGNRAAPWLPGAAFRNVQAAYVDGIPVFQREES